MKDVQKGQSLVEILIAIVVGSIFLLGVLATLSSAFKTRDTQDKLNRLVTTSSHIFDDLNQQVHWGGEVVGLGGGLLGLAKEGEEVWYEVDGGVLLKDGVAITPDEVRVTSFEVTDKGGGDLPLLHIFLVMEHIGQDPKVSYEQETTISLRATELQVK